ncbi:MAG: hypothetical protein R3181_08240 [Rubricoccaceae bacterium]|nr:hypothetical protein [Rubricoccaceae bacterium]
MLTLHHFAAASDEEAARYRILAGLQEARQAFVRSRVYPHLGELIRLRRALKAFLDGVDQLRDARPGRVTGIDWETGSLVRDPEDDDLPLLAEDLARWALPLLTDVLEEGRTLFEFVDEHAALAAVGLLPTYQQEGYLLVPDGTAGGQFLALRYAVSVLADESGRYRSLRTKTVAADVPPLAPPSAWKEALVAAFPDLPAPATFRLDTDVPFPVEETVLPVAKRKLLRLIADRGEA